MHPPRPFGQTSSRRLASLTMPLLVAGLAWPVAVAGDAEAERSGSAGRPEAAVGIPQEVEDLVTEAKGFYDSLADETKRKAFRRIAGTYDPGRAGVLQRPIDPPRRFGAMRLYPKAYDIARRVSALPLDQQQRIYAYAYDHQRRSGWLAAP